MRILSNPEVKKYNLNLFLIFIASIIIMVFVNIMSLNIIKDNIVINNYVFKGGFPCQTSYTILLSTRFLVLFYWELLY